jgi:hypothetical protein
MLQTLLQRAASLGLALTVALAVLGAIDQLAQPQETTAQWAQKAAPRA